MRKLIALFLGVTMTISMLAGCGKTTPDPVEEQQSTEEAAPAENSNEEENPVRIGFLFCGFDTPSVQAGVNSSKAKADELGIELIQLDGEFDAQKQVDGALQLLSMGLDAIIVNVSYTDTFTDTAKQICDAGIPLIAWCQNLNEDAQDYLDCFVGVDDTQCGPWAVGAIEDAFADQDSVNVVEIRGSLGSLCYNNRHNGFEEAIKDSDVTINLMETQVSENVAADEGQTIMENYLTKYDNIDVVYCVDDAVAAGAALAIENAGMKGDIMIIGINGEPNAFDLIKDGNDYVTLKQHIEWGAAEAVSCAYKLATGETVEKYTWDEWEVVTKDNVNSTEPAWPEG